MWDGGDDVSDCPDCGTKGVHDGIFIPRDPSKPVVILHQCKSEGCIIERWNERATEPLSTVLDSFERPNDKALALEKAKNGAYRERNEVVAAFAKLALARGFRVGIAPADPKEPDWPIVYVDLPAGQVSWHIHKTELQLFDGIPEYTGKWDGHDTTAKYARLSASRFAGAVQPRPEGFRETDSYFDWEA